MNSEVQILNTGTITFLAAVNQNYNDNQWTLKKQAQWIEMYHSQPTDMGSFKPNEVDNVSWEVSYDDDWWQQNTKPLIKQSLRIIERPSKL